MATESFLNTWDEKAWADHIANQEVVQESRAKLERRVSEFLANANPAEKNALETGRNEMYETLKNAQAEQAARYPETTAEEKRSRRQKFQKKVEACCRKFCEVTYEYSKIIDLLVSAAPEYVALAWGAIKIILVVQINHEELKQKVKEHMDLIKSKFETIDHLTVYMPKANLITKVAKAYELFARFLAKAVKYYRLNKFKTVWRTLSKPWHLELQGLVDEIDQTFLSIKDIAQYHGLLESHVSLELAKVNCQNIQKTIALQAEQNAKLTNLENILGQFVKVSLIRFNKEEDVRQSASLLQQRVDESVQEPEQDRTIDTKESASEDILIKTASTSYSTDSVPLRDDFFSDLRDLNADRSRREMAIEQSPQMREYRSRKRTLMKVDGFMAWVKSESSQTLWIDGNSVIRRYDFSVLFEAPLLVLGGCDYETMIVLRHDCSDYASSGTTGYFLLVKALLFQVFEQHPQVYQRRRSALTGETMNGLKALWDLLLNCLDDVKAACVFILIDNIDVLSQIDTEKGGLVVQKLNAMVENQTRLVKILLTASLATERSLPLNDGMALMTLRRRETVATINDDDQALTSHKLVEIQQKRCKVISFADLGLLYRPNTTVYTVEDGELQAFIVQEPTQSGQQYPYASSQLSLRAWSVDHDGKGFTKKYCDLTISQFSGERVIGALRYIPAGYLPDENKKRSHLLARGKLWWKYSSGVHHVVFGANRLQAIIDQKCQRPSEGGPESAHGLYLINEDSDLKPLYLILAPPSVPCFLLGPPGKMAVKVSDVNHHTYDPGVLDELMMPSEDKKLIQVLCNTHKEVTAPASSRSSTSGNFDRKSTRTMVLLQGPSGSGKKSTARYVAEYSQCPLLILSSLDLGTEPSVIEARLQDHLKQAERWNAMLLLEEVGHYFSDSGDIVRGSIVAVFLCALDRHRGMVFLTTAHSVQLDRVLDSRIQFRLKLEDLNDEQRAIIWACECRALMRERSEVDLEQSMKNFNEDPEFQKLCWRARKIRTAIQTALSLAEAENDRESSFITLTKAHILAFARMDARFKGNLSQDISEDDYFKDKGNPRAVQAKIIGKGESQDGN